MNDEDVKTLLPWYVNGTLDEQEKLAVEAYLEHSQEGRDEVKWLQNLQATMQTESEVTAPTELGFRRLQKAIAAEEQVTQLQTPSKQDNWWKPAFAVAATLIISLQIGIVSNTGKDPATELLSGNDTVMMSEQVIIQVQFKADAQWQDINNLVNAIDGQIISGPSAIGLCKIAIDKTVYSQSVMDQLQSSAIVEESAVESGE